VEVAVKYFAVIPTCGERNDTLFPMCRQLEDDGVTTLVVYNRRDPGPVMDRDFPSIPYADPNRTAYVTTHYWAQHEPVNLSKIWNIGLHWSEKVSQGEEYVVAVFNDDLTLPPGLVQAFAQKLQEQGSSAVYAHSTTDLPNMTDRDPWHLGNRMVGFAFALRGSDNLRADEDFLWWWGDSDLDWRARKMRGVSALGVPTLQHHDPNGYTNRQPELAEQAGRDRETFQRKNGFLPW
jgi:hypothetical protein